MAKPGPRGNALARSAGTPDAGRAAFRPNTVVTLMCLVPVILAAGAAAGRAIRAARS
ncbi:hypothetical protein [Pseudarthrobacter sp. Y6]|uniref:hypothetical protein n=1 Tax=Pseudarthrobacter sp. Y6 TaxID=3418422 RepID=UPI003CF78F51